MSTDAAFLARLAAAIQHHHESNLQLERLATELIDHISRMREYTNKLHVHIAAARQDVVVPETPAYTFGSEPLTLPRVLQGGPQVRDR